MKSSRNTCCSANCAPHGCRSSASLDAKTNALEQHWLFFGATQRLELQVPHRIVTSDEKFVDNREKLATFHAADFYETGLQSIMTIVTFPMILNSEVAETLLYLFLINIFR